MKTAHTEISRIVVALNRLFVGRLSQVAEKLESRTNVIVPPALPQQTPRIAYHPPYHYLSIPADNRRPQAHAS